MSCTALATLPEAGPPLDGDPDGAGRLGVVVPEGGVWPVACWPAPGPNSLSSACCWVSPIATFEPNATRLFCSNGYGAELASTYSGSTYSSPPATGCFSRLPKTTCDPPESSSVRV